MKVLAACLDRNSNPAEQRRSCILPEHRWPIIAIMDDVRSIVKRLVDFNDFTIRGDSTVRPIPRADAAHQRRFSQSCSTKWGLDYALACQVVTPKRSTEVCWPAALAYPACALACPPRERETPQHTWRWPRGPGPHWTGPQAIGERRVRPWLPPNRPALLPLS